MLHHRTHDQIFQALFLFFWGGLGVRLDYIHSFEWAANINLEPTRAVLHFPCGPICQQHHPRPVGAIQDSYLVLELKMRAVYAQAPLHFILLGCY